MVPLLTRSKGTSYEDDSQRQFLKEGRRSKDLQLKRTNPKEQTTQIFCIRNLIPTRFLSFDLNFHGQKNGITRAYENYDPFTYKFVKEGAVLPQSLLYRALRRANARTPQSPRCCHHGFKLLGLHLGCHMRKALPTSFFFSAPYSRKLVRFVWWQRALPKYL
ncbi:hypothetical protein BCR41DRAFT_373697 [Lobosporangium transversale]|uniref:Uncharacterized protein n=1 Tax=Lobosporangium transversale TaxID=64571 RepID=A0A1Y2GE49_9FUNG|nr:hypothetical protein BCR41DRAFT_373697 [Lobosporangium transversale]ORZ07269.1 hypothetical protein BCR41DRAFT_373697 [Lobosporangium transversale]|eukprot:XP_021877932.1 hypothetical protein BCR41DRAFT_373697 [Lobosporangium transversale]